MFKKFFKIIKNQNGQVSIVDIIILSAIFTIIGFTLFATLIPTFETGFSNLDKEAKSLKGGGM